MASNLTTPVALSEFLAAPWPCDDLSPAAHAVLVPAVEEAVLALLAAEEERAAAGLRARKTTSPSAVCRWLAENKNWRAVGRYGRALQPWRRAVEAAVAASPALDSDLSGSTVCIRLADEHSDPVDPADWSPYC